MATTAQQQDNTASTSTTTNMSSSNSSLSSQPSLLASTDEALVPWRVGDTRLRPVPAFYPPLVPQCTTFVTDATPSVVAARISDCLGRRSISAEFDNDTCTATCMTVDRVHFSIQLFRGDRNVTPKDVKDTSVHPDFSHGVIVEVVRQEGSTLSFHSHCRAILGAAKGYGPHGLFVRKRQASPLGFSNLERPRPVKRSRKVGPSEVCTSLERTWSLLSKDRIGAQQLGLESLVMLLDPQVSGTDVSKEVSKSILYDNGPVAAAQSIRGSLIALIQDRVLPGETEEEAVETSFADSVPLGGGDAPSECSQGSTARRPAVALEDAHSGGMLRSLGLRCFVNALQALEGPELSAVLTESVWVSRPFLQALAEDLLGAQRPPLAVAGTRLASAHEAAYAARCLRLLGQHSTTALHRFVHPRKTHHPTLDLLKKSESTTRHAVLKREVSETYKVLSAHVRTH
eukprot:CAMPEP_0194029366 /NCGR_PEP_ID=MMETSP0009_2-20130614/3102_1 /TAXON_ID=210454 /ORGANISM="Grammatophora oceanica, Strain CCMP 410" /LENGTH=456 /DNA_ID=CAMNT_0038669007 /DNA_START=200 /DNA_END=1570 /DNA_ORIENTATION=-